LSVYKFANSPFDITNKIMIQRTFLLLLALAASISAFAPSSALLSKTATPFIRNISSLQMSDSGGGSGGGGGGAEISKSTKKGLSTITIDKVEQKEEQEEIPEEQWRVVLHNDEVHTFNYVIQSLCKVIGTLDRKRAFDICVVTHGQGKATITKSWKAQAMKYCLGMQRQGLTASIAPENRFTGDGDGGGGEPSEGGGE
jgi:ATP-dependent Clp protease adapter protein ClpS